MKQSSHGFHLALVTGASSGIGEELCHLLAKQGIDLIVTGRNKSKLDTLKENLPVNVTVCPVDLTDREDRKKLITLISDRIPDLVINNAGFGIYGKAFELPVQDQMNLLEVNCGALLELSLESGRALKKAGMSGVIMNISSAAAYQTFPLFAVYAASKAFVNSFSEAFDDELRSSGVRCLASCPGMVDTSFRSVASKGKVRKKPSILMSVEFAAEEIWWQILRRKPVHIFDWRFRLLTFISRFIPKSILFRLLRSNIKQR